MGEIEIVNTTRTWVEDVVVGYNLCPFAKRELVRNRVRFVVSDAGTEDELLHALHSELQRLEDEPEIETTLLIHPGVLQDFASYNEFLDAAENYTNRSPFPMLHLLREASLEAAIDSYPDVDGIPQRNIELMEQLGAEKMRKTLAACFGESAPGRNGE